MTPAVGASRRMTAVLAGLLVIVGVTALDAHYGPDEVFITIVIVAPFLTALAADRRDTALIGILALAATIASGGWNDAFFTGPQLIRVVGVGAAAVLAVLSAGVRSRDLVAQRRLALLAAVSEVANGELTLDATVRRISELLVPDVADLAVIYAKQRGVLTRIAVKAAGPDAAALAAQISARPVEDSPVWLAGGGGPPLLVSRVDDAYLRTLARGDEQDLEGLRNIGLASVLIVPLRARGRVVGVQGLVTRELSGRRFSTDDLRFAEVLSGRVALALDNAGLYSELESTEAQLTAALGSLSDAVTVQNAEGRLVYANDAAARSMGFASPQELLATPPERILARFDTLGDDGRAVTLEDLPGRRVLNGETPRPLVVRARDRATGEERWQMIKASPVRDREGRPYLAVNIVEDITDIKRAEAAQRMLVQAGALLSSSLDVDITLQRVAELVVPELADWCSLALPEPTGTIRQVAIAHVDPAKVAFAREYNRRYPDRIEDETGAAAVLRSGEPALVTEIPDALLEQALPDREQLELIRSIGMRSVIMVPLLSAGLPIGVLSLVSAESGRVFSEADLALAQELGRRAGTAIQNARLYAERTHIARTLQTGLLPDALPDVPGLGLATLYRPAGEENWVGGDFYDAFPVGDGWMVVVGDVAGRGPEAAALTALARHTLRTAATIGPEPLQALEHLNRELLARPMTSLVTIACALVERDPAAGTARARIVCAGHPPALLVRAGEVAPLGRFGPMLGAFPGSSWQTVDVDLADGDVLVLYTDGVIDTRGLGGRFGEQRLHETVGGAVDADDAVRRIDAALHAFESGDQADDTAIVAIRCGPPAEPGAVRHRLELAGGLTAPRRARRAVRAWLAGQLPPDRLYDVQVLVSELVTNAIRHADTSPEATVLLEAVSSPHTLRVAVTDAGPGFEPPNPLRPRPQGGGAGLVLVDRLSSRWAVDPGPPSVVWFEFDREAASAAA